MKEKELNKLWELYREFCEDCNQANLAPYAVEFLVWLKKFKLEDLSSLENK